MKKVLNYLILSLGLLLGLTIASTTTVQADQTTAFPAGSSFAVTSDANLFDGNGNQLPTSVKAGTNWAVNGEFYHGDDTFYRIATNTMINANNGYLYRSQIQDLKVISQTPARLYTYKGELVKNRALAAGSVWYSDRAISQDHMTYYRVATNEFVLLSDVNVK